MRNPDTADTPTDRALSELTAAAWVLIRNSRTPVIDGHIQVRKGDFEALVRELERQR